VFGVDASEPEIVKRMARIARWFEVSYEYALVAHLQASIGRHEASASLPASCMTSTLIIHSTISLL
jgi:hypothetical protein